MSTSLDGKTAVVTGGGSGIGAATCRRFAEAGAAVAVLDRNLSGAEATVAQIGSDGRTAQAFSVDVADEASVARAFEAVCNRFGGVDVAHNNAGISGVHALVHEYPTDVWQSVLDVNLTGVMLCMQRELELMAANGVGAIVNTCSSGGVLGMPMSAAYVASKHGVAGLTRVAALEYGDMGVRVNAVLPGLTDTPMGAGQPPELSKFLADLHPMRRMAQPEEIAAAVVWLCSDEASFVHGSLFAVDGGFIAGVTARPNFEVRE